MKLKHWLWLFLIQVIWASSYIAMKVAVAELPVSGVVFLRYGIAALGFVGIWAFTGFPRLKGRDLALILILGAFSFALSPVLQITGIQYTQAVDVSILISFEPIIMVLVAALALRERPNRRTLLALLIATAGLIVLSGISDAGNGEGHQLRLLGNLLFLSALVFEGAVSVSGRALTRRYRADHLIGAMMIAGFLAGTVVNGASISTIDFRQISDSVWGAVIFLGLGCSIFTYVVWFRVLKDVPVNRVALSLFVQPVAGTILGSSLLDEEVNVRTLAGALLICASLIWWQVRENQATGAEDSEVQTTSLPKEVVAIGD